MDIRSGHYQDGHFTFTHSAHQMLQQSEHMSWLNEAIARENRARNGEFGGEFQTRRRNGLAERMAMGDGGTEAIMGEEEETEIDVEGLELAEEKYPNCADGKGLGGTAFEGWGSGSPISGLPFDRRQLAQFREDFNAFLWLHYESKSRHRTLINRRTMEHLLRRLRAAVDSARAGASVSAARQRLCERYAVGVADGREQLLQRGTGRVFVPVEEIFDALQRFHAEMGHSRNRMALYAGARARFANVGMDIVREYLRGSEHALLGLGATGQ